VGSLVSTGWSIWYVTDLANFFFLAGEATMSNVYIGLKTPKTVSSNASKLKKKKKKRKNKKT
jgi:hypothetical protein